MQPLSGSNENAWDEEIVSFLTVLSDVQQEMLDYLAEKRELLAKGDAQGLLVQQAREQDLIERLQSCHQQRQEILGRAAGVGLPGQNLKRLSTALDGPRRQRVSPILAKASHQARLLHHHSLTNWVLAQRSLIHISHLIEILATGGKLQPTYGRGASETGSGGLVDREAKCVWHSYDE